jgi:hypothetical protein
LNRPWSLLDDVTQLGLKLNILRKGTSIQHDRVIIVEPVIADAKEKCLSLRNERQVINSMTNLRISRDSFCLLRIFHKRNKPAEEIDLGNYCHENLNRNVKRCLDKYADAITVLMP